MFSYQATNHPSHAQTVRWSLIICSCVLLVCAIFLLSTSILLLRALKKENELKFIYFLKSLVVFGALRFLIMLFELVVNDLYYFYHQFNYAVWTLFAVANLFAYLVVLSNYQELKDLTKLSQLTKEKGVASMNVSRSLLQDTSHLDGALSTISNKLSTSSICGGSTVSESFNKAYQDQQKQQMLQQQQLQQLKLNQAYNQLKNSTVPLQNPSLL